MPSYCSPADLVSFGVPQDHATQAACDFATETIDSFCGTVFGGAVTKTITFFDVRTEVLPLPVPFSAITAVKINNQPLDVSVWTVDTMANALRLYVPGIRDVDGFVRTHTSITRNRGPYGQNVAVTGRFGYESVPSPVFEAARRIGSRQAILTVDDQLPPPGVQMIAGEGFQLRIDKSERGYYNSTGDIDADRMLAPYRSVFGLVA